MTALWILPAALAAAAVVPVGLLLRRLRREISLVRSEVGRVVDLRTAMAAATGELAEMGPRLRDLAPPVRSLRSRRI